MYKLSLSGVIGRFYLMMACVIIPFFIGVPVLAFLAFPIFLSIMFGITFNRPKGSHSSTRVSKRRVELAH